MATTLYLRDTEVNAIGIFNDLISTAGASNLGYFVTSVAGPAQVQWQVNGSATPNVEWITGRAPSGGFTLSGSTTFNIYANESSLGINCGLRARLFKRTWAGVETEISGSPYDDDAELTDGGSTLNTWTSSVTSTVFGEDDRLILRLYIIDKGGTMDGGFCTLNYEGAVSSSFESNMVIPQTVTFKAAGDPDGSHSGGGTLTGRGIGRGVARGIGRGVR